MLIGGLAIAGLQSTRVVYRAFWFGVADPMPREAPVIWSVDTGHARRLDALAHRLSSCLPPGSSLVVDSEALDLDADQAFFWSLWLAHFMPRHDVRPARPGSDFRPGADYWLHRPDDRPASELGTTCATDGFVVTPLGEL